MLWNLLIFLILSLSGFILNHGAVIQDLFLFGFVLETYFLILLHRGLFSDTCLAWFNLLSAPTKRICWLLFFIENLTHI
jgi:hypothetical protein